MRALASLLLMALTSTTLAADEGRTFGRLRFGMTPEEARAAYPEAAWTVLVATQKSGRIAEIRGASVLEIGGWRYDLELGSQYGSSHHWKIGSTAAAANAADCESRAAALIADLETRFGAFEAPGKLLGTEEAVSVGRASQMKTDAAGVNRRGISRAQALKKDAALYFVRARHTAARADDLEIMVSADYEAARGRECSIEARLDGQTPPPPALNVSFDAGRVIAGPSISYRNRSLRDIGVPATPIEFVVPCSVRVSDGKIGSCINGAAGENIDPYRRLASNWALRYRLDMGATDPEDRTMYPIDVPVTLSAADVRDVDLTGARILDVAQLKVVRGQHVDASDYFPSDPALRKTAADVTVCCQVQEDGSLICGIKPGGASPASAFTEAAVRFAENLEVEPTLLDGTSAVGGIIERRVRFSPAR